MYRIKAIAAVALAGLGGATVGTDAYMVAHHGAVPPVREVPAPVQPAPQPPAARPTESPVVMLEPVTIASRVPMRHKLAAPVASPPEERRLVPCSQWRSLETGPADRGVRTLCLESVSTR